MEEGRYIWVKGLCKSYKGNKALHDINMAVKKNELFGVLGPDGSGKTTLFRILTTLLLPDKGLATINNYDAVKDYKKIRKIIGYMPGRFSLYHDLTVEENLSFYATIFGTTIDKNYHLIKDIYNHIEPFKYRRAGHLSGGMKQKLALSCALIHKPEVLILDEPTTGIDAVSRKEFWEMLKKLQNHGITILVSTPYMDEAELCNRVALIQKGEIMQIETPEQVVSHFKGSLYAIRSDNLYKLLKDMRQYKNTSSVQAFGQVLHYSPVRPEKNHSELKVFLKERQHKHILIEKIQPTIEDCFMDLMTAKTG